MMTSKPAKLPAAAPSIQLNGGAAERALLFFGEQTEGAVRLAYHLTRNREAAMDLSQEAFVRAMEGLGRLDDPAKAKAWFHRILVNLCRDWLRRKAAERRALANADAPNEAADDPAEAAQRREVRERVRAALLRLPEDYREALALVSIEGYEPKEAAEILNVPAGTLRWRIHEGRRLLKEILDRWTANEK